MVGSCICFEVIVDIEDFAAADRAPCCVRRWSRQRATCDNVNVESDGWVKTISGSPSL